MKFFIFFSILSIALHAYADCDKIVCSNAAQVSVSPDFQSLTQRLGIRVNSDPKNILPPLDPENEIAAPPAAPPAYTPNFTQRERSGSRSTTQQAQTATPVSGDTTAAADQANNDNNNNGGGSGGGGGGSGGGNTSAASAPENSDVAGKGSQQIGQIIYSDENDDDDDKIDSDFKAPTPISNNVAAVTPDDPTGKSKKKDSGGGSTSLPAVSGDNAPIGSPLGNYQSGAKVAAAQKGAAAQALEGMNTDEYFGADGSGKTGRRRGKYGSSRFKKGRQIASVDKDGLTLSAKAELQRRLLRNLASTGQLGKKNEFLFFSMCKHYDNYERANNINYGRSKCPPKK